MRYYSARQRESDLRWDYTCGRNPVGYCSCYREFTDVDDWLSESVRNTENAKMIKNKHKYHTDGHATEEEACECYKQYLLDNSLRLTPKLENPSQLNKCKVCGEFCSGYAVVGECEFITLCEKHCNRDEVEKICTVGEMWIS